MLKIRLIKNKKERNKVFKIRYLVFVKGQNVPIELEMDKYDKTAKHIIAFYGKNVVGCGRIRFKGKKAKLERIAILKKYRGKGFGKEIVRYMIKYCKRRKVKEIMMYAQHYLKKFYGNLGFKVRGKIFTEAGIKHIEMYMKN